MKNALFTMRLKEGVSTDDLEILSEEVIHFLSGPNPYNTEVYEYDEPKVRPGEDRKLVQLHIHNCWWNVLADGQLRVITEFDWDMDSEHYELVEE